MGKSIQEFSEWAVAQGSNISNPTDNAANKYPGECVSLVQQYLEQVFGIPYAPRGHAKNFVPPNFSSVGTGVALRAGDIVRYPGTYGHIGVIDHDNYFLDQNQKLDAKVRRGNLLSGYTAVFRPNLPFKVRSDARKTVEQIADEVIAGGWGNGVDRQNRLLAAGYDYSVVQAAVNRKLSTPPPQVVQREFVHIVGDYRSLYASPGGGKFATLSPNQYGGLDYQVLARSGDYVQISTKLFGTGWIFCGASVASLTSFYKG